MRFRFGIVDITRGGPVLKLCSRCEKNVAQGQELGDAFPQPGGNLFGLFKEEGGGGGGGVKRIQEKFPTDKTPNWQGAVRQSGLCRNYTVKKVSDFPVPKPSQTLPGRRGFGK